MSIDSRRALRDEITNLMESITDDQSSMVIDAEVSSRTKQENPYDFDEISKSFTKKAREITDSLFKTYVDLGVFTANDYAKHKKELDTINLANFLFQMKTIKITITKVMEEIASGNTHPRLLDSMGSLQDKLSSLTKMQANYMVFLEETYQKLNNEKQVNPDQASVPSSPDEGKYFITVGTKNVIKNLPAHEKSADGPMSGDLIDPSNKVELMREKNIKNEEKLEDDFFDIDTIL